MRRSWSIAALALALVSASEPARACRMRVSPTFQDIQYADVVVIGRIANYRIIRDTDERRLRLANPKISREDRERYSGKHSLLTDYARFDVLVDEVLVGKPPKTITVTWNNSTFGEPATMTAVPRLIALRDPHSPVPPLRGPSGYIPAQKEPGVLTVLQAPCSSAFLFETTSTQAQAVLALLNKR